MSIIVINHHAIIEKYGYNNRHYKIGKSLSEKGIDFTLISSSLRQSNQEYIHSSNIKLDKVNKNFKFISIKTRPRYNTSLKRLINYIDFAFKVSKLTFDKSPEHIIGSSVHPFTWIPAYYLSKKYNAKFHIEIRDIWPLSLHEDLTGILRKLVFKIFNTLEKRYYPLASSIIVTAPKANKYLIKHYGVEESKIFYVPHSIDVNKYYSDLINYEYPIIDKDFERHFNITYTGSLSSSEGLNNLLYLAKELAEYKNIRIHIFGGGSEFNHLSNIVKNDNLENVKLHGNVKAKYIPYILNKSDILWAGLKERKVFKYGISKNKFYEYIASKKPIIFHSNVKYSPLNDVKNAYLVSLDQSSKSIVLDIMNGKVKKFDSIEFLEQHHSDTVIAHKFLKALTR